MSTNFQELEGWISERNCDLRNALEFGDSTTVVKVGALLSQAQPNSHQFRETCRWTGCLEIFTDGIDDRGEDSCRWGPAAVGIAVIVGEPSLRARYGLRGVVRVGEASHQDPLHLGCDAFDGRGSRHRIGQFGARVDHDRFFR